MIASLVAAIRFLTRVPVPGRPTRVEDIARGVGWFPLVGALVGGATAGVFALGLRAWPAPLAAAVAVGFGLMLTGGFHEDGATDAMDGLGGGWTRERVLEIMKDSRIGAYGAMALWVLLAVRWSALVALEGRALWALPLAMVWGRWSISALMGLLPPVAPGLAKEVGGQGRWGPFLGATALLVLANLLCLGRPGLARAALAAPAVLGLWALYLKRRLGGQSGDLLGAGNQLVEAAVLLALVAK
ncbi:adenosylcobinamide-GDP ribazoletransferase [Mesoterricola silvestris]|uniref:Adenosylcobinamide-GDP ribazoletransferase n=1 Tax=Mesoterricola silvestris TaxID=2927979 RepID=A0AA48K6J2_9BACT|nr:adenosylcobinamide-GDP ribazoletransferase [Mesoterricola silvestris]BDU70879.1 adenosylcobinamide-GDP ribazoletransferase [Mesoterricola silvestris]